MSGRERTSRVGRPMPPISSVRHQFLPVVIQHAVWLCVRFTLSYRDVKDPLAEHRLDVSYETVRRWVLKFGPAIARRLRQGRARPRSTQPQRRWWRSGTPRRRGDVRLDFGRLCAPARFR